MSSVAVNARPQPDLDADLRKARRIAVLMDSQFSILGFRIGWDPIIGVIPVVGDIATAIVGLYPIIIARRHNLGRGLQLRMGVNLFIDWAVGEIPVLGDIFDAGYK